ncbi:cytochrome c553 [Sphingomonas zeicaulis]|uniref:c-type cytochrome n=1 Tax=Sphingomonas zeicaulis TaxID=1632740 RepID=UPI003D2409CE
MKITLKRGVLGLIVAAVAGMAFAWSGLFNVAASSGHWAITDWFLHWVMQNSAATWSRIEGEKQPVDASGLVSAAGLFDQSCVACHGAPGIAPLPVMQAATPPAPDLGQHPDKWTAGEHFWIIKHGVKFTGMPGWAAEERDDEVRRMTAFVRALPTMSPQRYRALTRDPAETGSDPLIATCTGCHGVDGRGRGGPDTPILGGQSVTALRRALDDYASGRRASAVMGNAAARLSPADRQRLAEHFAALPGLPRRQAAVTDGAAARMFAQGNRSIELPACAQCHDRDNGKAPRLAGQKASYVAGRLHRWHADEKAVESTQPRDTMAMIARRIPKEMIDPLAREIEARGR